MPNSFIPDFTFVKFEAEENQHTGKVVSQLEPLYQEGTTKSERDRDFTGHGFVELKSGQEVLFDLSQQTLAPNSKITLYRMYLRMKPVSSNINPYILPTLVSGDIREILAMVKTNHGSFSGSWQAW